MTVPSAAGSSSTRMRTVDAEAGAASWLTASSRAGEFFMSRRSIRLRRWAEAGAAAIDTTSASTVAITTPADSLDRIRMSPAPEGPFRSTPNESYESQCPGDRLSPRLKLLGVHVLQRLEGHFHLDRLLPPGDGELHHVADLGRRRQLAHLSRVAQELAVQADDDVPLLQPRLGRRAVLASAVQTHAGPAVVEVQDHAHHRPVRVHPRRAVTQFTRRHRRDLHLQGLVLAPDLVGHRLAGPQAHPPQHDILPVAHRLAIDPDHAVIDLHARLGGGAFGDHPDYPGPFLARVVVEAQPVIRLRAVAHPGGNPATSQVL